MGFFDFLDSIGQIFGEISQLVSQLFAALWNAMVYVFNYIWQVIVGQAEWNYSNFQGIGTFFKHLWDDYLKTAILWVIAEIQKIISWIHKILDPLLRWIQKIRKWYEQYVLPGIQRQLALIQKIRQFLALLRIFHVKFATTLDNYLANLQSRIEQTVAATLGYLNLIISWIALVTDPNMIIRQNTLGAWLLANLGILKRAVGYGGNRPLTAAEKAQMAASSGIYYGPTVTAHIQALALTGPTVDDQTRRDAARTALVQVTGQPLPL